MNFSDQIWASWAAEPFKPSTPAYQCSSDFGTPAEPMSSLWCASLINPLKDRLSSPFTILDWGCGDGRLFNFLSRRFENFRYHGLERPGEFGNQCTARAKSFFQHDARATFDVYDTPAEQTAVSSADFVVMGSIATHLPIELFETLVRRIQPVLLRGGTLIASFFLGDQYTLHRAALYGHNDCYAYVYYTVVQIQELCAKTGLTFEIKDTLATEGFIHQILAFTKA